MTRSSDLDQPGTSSTLSRKRLLRNAGIGAAVGLVAPLPRFGIARASSPVTLRIMQWNNPSTVSVINKLDSAFQAKYPDIKVEMTFLPSPSYPTAENTRLSANAVDIFADFGLVNAVQSWSPGAAKPTWQQYIESGLIQQLDGQPFLKNYFPKALANASTYNGHIYSVTTGSYALNGVFYNKDIFSKYSLSVPTTWDELMTIAKTLKSHGMPAFTMGGKTTWPIDVAAEGIIDSLYPNQAAYAKGLWTGTIKYTDPKEVQALTQAQQLLQYTQTGFMGLDYIAAPGQFAVGRAAMYPGGSWDGANILAANPSINMGFFPMPGSNNAADNHHLYGKYDLAWFVAAKSPNKAAAYEWISFFSEPANYSTYANAVGIIPSQPHITLTAPEFSTVKSLFSSFSLDSGLILPNPPTSGKYAGYHPEFLAPAGPIAAPAALAKLEQSDWQAALTAAEKKK